jgi:hypothetical protein
LALRLLSLEKQGHRGTEKDRLGDGGEDREDLVHGAARARRWQVEETMEETLAEDGGLYRNYLDR